MNSIRIHINTQSQRMLVFSFSLGLLFFLVLSFKTANSAPKNYLVLNYSTYHQRFDVVGSDGILEKRNYQVPSTANDQSEVLKVVREYEAKGYKLFNYDVDYVGKGQIIVNAILMR